MDSRPVRIGSLFSGIGGLELGLERAIPNARTVWQVEADPYARAVLAKHWLDVPRFEDVRAVTGDDLPPCDLICGGFPCQDISTAGRGAGLAGEKSGLWSEYVRLVREIRPRFVVVENVAALLGRGFSTVLGDLAALGYDAVWDCVPAQAVGAHHRRDRVFIVAYSNGRPDPTLRGQCAAIARQGLIRSTIGIGCDGNVERKTPIRSSRQFTSALRRTLAENREPWQPEPSVGRVADGIPRRVDRLRCLGNAVVPQVAEVIGRVVQSIAGEPLAGGTG
mgnify:CR=1 FL=1